MPEFEKMIRVVEDACKFDETNIRADIVLESLDTNFPRAIEQLEHMTTKFKALGYATSKGVNKAAMDGQSTSVYPVNSEGISFDKVVSEDGQPLPPTHKLMQPAFYRITVPVRSALL